MHIEPGIVDGAKLVLSYATAAGAAGYALKLSIDAVREKGAGSLLARAVFSTVLVFFFFQILPHYAVGVSEVHFILGSTLFLLFGIAPAAIGLAAGLLLQGVLFAPGDLPQLGMNLTTLLVPLFALGFLANKIIKTDTAYVDLKYSQVLALSAAYQGGIVAWVMFWAFYGQGFGAENVAAVLAFSAAYLLVILLEPLIGLAVLAAAKSLKRSLGQLEKTGLVTPRLFQAA